MKNATVQISYPSEKLAAIQQYMGKKDVEMNAELQDALTKLYEKHVPREVREYLESQESAKAYKQPRRPARQTPSHAPGNTQSSE